MSSRHLLALGLVLVPVALAACYTNAPANRDVQAAWRGRARGELEGRWGSPARQAAAPPAHVLVWAYHTTDVTLPDASLAISAHPVAAVAHAEAPGAAGTVAVEAAALDVSGSFRPGGIWHVTHEAAAFVDPAGVVAAVQGEALHWGPPNDVNLHWGTIMGVHVGMGRLDSTSTPLPSGGAYLGGMLNPTLGLVGTFSLAAGSDRAGGALGMAGGLAAQWWPVNRFWLRAGPALLLAFDPGFDNARLEPGGVAGASYAFVKVGTFAVDLRLDLAAGLSTAFGTVGIGVALN